MRDELQALPAIGPSMAADLRRLGVRSIARAYFAQSPMRRARSTSWVLLPSTIESTVIV